MIYLFILDGLKLYQLPEPLTGKVWTLEDFEAYPALLVRCHYLHFFCLLSTLFVFLTSLIVHSYVMFGVFNI